MVYIILMYNNVCCVQVYANGSAVPFMLPPFAAAGGSPLYPVMRPVKLESEW